VSDVIRVQPERTRHPVVAAVYTGRGLDDQILAVAPEILGSARVTSIIDDSIIFDINRNGCISPAVTRRILRYYRNAADAGATVILNTCSSVGEIVELGRSVVEIPIVRIDEPMAQAAATGFDRIGVVATLQSTLGPTKRLVAAKAEEASLPVHLVAEVATGAYEALARRDTATHDQLVTDAVAKLSREVDVVVLAQASMARMRDRLEEAARVPVLTSLRSGLEAVRAALASLGEFGG